MRYFYFPFLFLFLRLIRTSQTPYARSQIKRNLTTKSQRWAIRQHPTRLVLFYFHFLFISQPKIIFGRNFLSTHHTKLARQNVFQTSSSLVGTTSFYMPRSCTNATRTHQSSNYHMKTSSRSLATNSGNSATYPRTYRTHRILHNHPL